MICSNCFNDEYQTAIISKEVTVNGIRTTIQGIECEKCPSCQDIIFTHKQSLELDKKRINLEFSSKPVLTPYQLRLLRKILGMSLDDVCGLLHIGKNSYGRWERGEVEISPSMNLLVHQLIDKFHEAKVNLFESEMHAEIEKAKIRYFTDSVSLGEFIRSVITSTKLLTDIICDKIGIRVEEFEQIENNEINPETIPARISANILKFFHLTMDNLRQLLENTLKIYSIKQKFSFVHARQPGYGKEAPAIQSRSINRILERYVIEDEAVRKQSISPKYLKKVRECLQTLEGNGH